MSGSVQTTAIGNEIFVCGGFSGGKALQTCGVYTPATDSWSGMPDMPHGVHHAAAGTGVVPVTGKPPPGVYSLPFTQPCHLQSSSLGRQSLHPASPVAIPLHAVFAHFEFILAVRPVMSHRW